MAVQEVPLDQVRRYGIVAGDDLGQRLMRVRHMVEKPSPENAPSRMAVAGRYILTPRIMDNLNKKKSGAAGEIQLTDAIATEIAAANNVYGFRFRGQRFDCGSKAGFLQATVAFGLARDDLHDEFAAFLHEMVSVRKAAE